MSKDLLLQAKRQEQRLLKKAENPKDNNLTLEYTVYTNSPFLKSGYKRISKELFIVFPFHSY
jgi:hypothetical protein